MNQNESLMTQCVSVAEQPVEARIVEDDVRRGVIVLQKMAVAEHIGGEHEPIGREYPQEALAQECGGGLCFGTQREAQSAQNDEDIDPEIAVQPVGPADHPAHMVEHDQNDRQTLVFVEESATGRGPDSGSSILKIGHRC